MNMIKAHICLTIPNELYLFKDILNVWYYVWYDKLWNYLSIHVLFRHQHLAAFGFIEFYLILLQSHDVMIQHYENTLCIYKL